MIYAHFFKFGKLCSGFSISGHAGYADYGKDIACASVTSAVELTANGITEILGLPAELNLQENEIRLSLTKESDMIAAQPFLDAILLNPPIAYTITVPPVLKQMGTCNPLVNNMSFIHKLRN